MLNTLLIPIMLSIITNLAMYIIVSTIDNQSAQQTQNYFKEQIEGLRQTMVNSTLQQQQNLMSQIKQNHQDLLSQVKESERGAE